MHRHGGRGHGRQPGVQERCSQRDGDEMKVASVVGELGGGGRGGRSRKQQVQERIAMHVIQGRSDVRSRLYY